MGLVTSSGSEGGERAGRGYESNEPQWPSLEDEPKLTIDLRERPGLLKRILESSDAEASAKTPCACSFWMQAFQARAAKRASRRQRVSG
jgi:hypothetical protein